MVEEAPFDISVVESGTVQALRSVTYASTIQSNQAKIIALVPEGKLVQKGDMLILFDGAPFEEEIRRTQAQLSLAQADIEKAQQDLKLQSIQNQEELAAARQKVERSRLELADVTEGKGRLREEEAKAAVGNAERDLEKAIGAHDDLRPLLAEGFITKQELDRAAQAVSRAREDLALAKRRHDSLVQFGRPLELSQAQADASLTRESVRQLEAAAQYRLEQKRSAIAAAESRIAGGQRQAGPGPPAARAHRGARRRARHRRLQGRLLRVRAAEAPGGRPGLGQPAAAHPARHLQDGGGDEGPRDGHPQGREEPERGRARAGLSRPQAQRAGHAGGDPGPGGEGAARGQVLRRDGAGRASPTRACGRG